jgi:hypothetical protein
VRSREYGFRVSDDWRNGTIDELRSLILKAEPDIVEEAKWRKASNPDGVPTFSCAGLVCTVETYKDKVKLTFANGASLNDPSGLSMPVWTPARDAPSISTRATSLMRTPSSRWSGRPSLAIGPEPSKLLGGHPRKPLGPLALNSGTGDQALALRYSDHPDFQAHWFLSPTRGERVAAGDALARNRRRAPMCDTSGLAFPTGVTSRGDAPMRKTRLSCCAGGDRAATSDVAPRVAQAAQ